MKNKFFINNISSVVNALEDDTESTSYEVVDCSEKSSEGYIIFHENSKEVIERALSQDTCKVSNYRF